MIDILASEIKQSLDLIPELKEHYRDKNLFLGLIRHINSAPNAKVYLVVFDEASTLPLFFVKVARFDSGNSFLRRTHDNLLWVKDSRELKDLRSSFPYPVLCKSINNHYVQVESYLDGEPIRSLIEQKGAERFSEVATDWLIDFHRKTSNQVILNEELIEQLFLSPLRSVRALIGNDQRFAQFFREMQLQANRKIGLKTSLVFAHNNFSLKNIKIKNDRIMVIDWENAQRLGLPFLDLVHLVFSYQLSQNKNNFAGALRSIFNGQIDKNFTGDLHRYIKVFNLDDEYIRFLLIQFLFSKLLNVRSYRDDLLKVMSDIATGRIVISSLRHR